MEPWRDELYHHQILGGKWGVRNGPPYPLAPSKHSAAEKRKNPGLFKKMAERRAEKKRKQKQQEQVRKMQEAKRQKAEQRKQEEAAEAEKQRVLREGSAEEVMKYQGQLTNQQLQDAYNRLNNERNIRNLITKPQEVSTTPVNNFPKEQVNSGKAAADKAKKKLSREEVFKGMDKLSGDIKTIGNLAQNTATTAKNMVSAYNTGVAIYNAYDLAKGKQSMNKIKVDWSLTTAGNGNGEKKDKKKD